MNHQETAKLLAVMNTVWKDNTDADGRSQTIAYQMALEDVSYHDASEAVKVCMKELTFFPKPVEVLDRVRRRRGPRSAYDMGYLPRPLTGPNSRPIAPVALHDGERLVG